MNEIEVKRMKVKFYESKSGFCEDIYKVVEYDGKHLSSSYVCRQPRNDSSPEWNTYTNGEPDCPLRNNLEIEISGTSIIDKVVNTTGYAVGAVLFPFSWECDENESAKFGYPQKIRKND